jgi:hypothetical protein
MGLYENIYILTLKMQEQTKTVKEKKASTIFLRQMLPLEDVHTGLGLRSAKLNPAGNFFLGPGL